MVQTSALEVIVDAPKTLVHMLANNPAFVSGVLGHISILEVYDPDLGTFVKPEELTTTPSKFRVAYIFGTPDKKLSIELGEMEGPIFGMDTVTYKGFTYDKKMKWEIVISLKEVSPGKTRIQIISKSEEERGLFDRFLGRSQFSLAEHAIKSHIGPFLKLYSRQLAQYKATADFSSVEYMVVAQEEGVVSEVMAKLIRTAKEKNIEHALIALDGDNFKGKVVLDDGKPTEAWFRCTDGSIKTGKDAILEALTASANGKGQLLMVDIRSLIDSVLDQVYTNISLKQPKKNQA